MLKKFSRSLSGKLTLPLRKCGWARSETEQVRRQSERMFAHMHRRLKPKRLERNEHRGAARGTPQMVGIASSGRDAALFVSCWNMQAPHHGVQGFILCRTEQPDGTKRMKHRACPLRLRILGGIAPGNRRANRFAQDTNRNRVGVEERSWSLWQRRQGSRTAPGRDKLLLVHGTPVIVKSSRDTRGTICTQLCSCACHNSPGTGSQLASVPLPGVSFWVSSVSPQSA